MRRSGLLVGFLFIACCFAFSQAPVLGTYGVTVVAHAGGNSVVTPTTVPQNTTSVTAYTSPKFNGTLYVNPTTGQVYVINARPAGTYTITLKAFNATSATTTDFVLTVNNTACNQGVFEETGTLTGLYDPKGIAIGDFNNDGNQDFVEVQTNNSGTVIRLGNGNGGFTNAAGLAFPQSSSCLGTGDFNGDGKLDLLIGIGTIYTFLGTGTGSFNFGANSSGGNSPYAMVVKDFNGDGRLDFVVTNPSSNTVLVRYGTGTGSFSGGITLQVGNSPYFLVSSDFNGDGKADLATANTSANTVSIKLGDGAGGFFGNGTIPVGVQPLSITTADFDKDNKPDFAVGNLADSSVSIKWGDGLGGFPTGIVLKTNGLVTAVTTGDFNGDGYPDILAGCNDVNGVYVFLGDGNRNFYLAGNTGIGAQQFALAAGDFNNDGVEDFLSANNNATISLRMGKPDATEINVKGNDISIPDGTTSTSSANNTNFGTRQFRTFTIENTGQEYLTVKNITISGSDSTAFNVSNISFPARVAPNTDITFTVQLAPLNPGIKTATVNVYSNDCDESIYNYTVQGTGILVSIGNYPTTTITSAGGGTSILPSALPTNLLTLTATASPGFEGILQVSPSTGVVTVTNAWPAGTYTVFIKGSTGQSVVTTSFTLNVNNAACSQGYFAAGTAITTLTAPRGLAIGDFNGDGRQDMALANYNTNNVSIRLGNNTGTFTEGVTIQTGNGPQAIAVADFNGDGNQDFVSANYQSSSVSVRFGDGTGNFYGSLELPVGSLPTNIWVADFNLDRKPDFITADLNTASYSVRLGNGLGGFTIAPSLSIGYSPVNLAIGDFNGDNKPDIAFINTQNTGTITIRLGDGMGAFTTSSTTTLSSSPSAIAAADFNKDGKMDVAIAANSGVIYIRLGDGQGGLSGTTSVVVGSNPQDVKAADFNGDGNADLAVLNYGSGSISIRLGNGLGGFSSPSEIATTSSPVSLVIGDFNVDGLQDLAFCNLNLNNVAILLNRQAEINITGNANPIVDGDSTTSATNYTNFGAVPTGVTFTRNFTIQNNGTGSLTITGITINGANATQFSSGGITLYPTVITAGSSRTFTVTFSPGSPGIKTANIHVLNNDCDESSYDFLVSGGVTGAALSFDGVNDIINTNTAPAGFGKAGFTIQTWFNTNSANANMSLINNRLSCTDQNYWNVGMQSGKLLFELSESSSSSNPFLLTTTLTYNDSLWHHLSASRNGTQLTIWVDGNLVATSNTSDTINLSSSNPLHLGGNTCSFYGGRLDETRIWSKVLSNCELKENYNCEITSSVTGLLINYHYNQGIGSGNNPTVSYLSDASGNGFNGTLSQFALSGSISNWITSGAVISGLSCANNIWLGYTTDWRTPGNWSFGVVPTPSTMVQISNCAANMPIVTGTDNACYKLSATGGASVTIATGAQLKITAGQ